MYRRLTRVPAARAPHCRCGAPAAFTRFVILTPDDALVQPLCGGCAGEPAGRGAAMVVEGVWEAASVRHRPYKIQVDAPDPEP